MYYYCLLKALDHAYNAMVILGSRSVDPILWDSINQLISKVTFIIAIDLAVKAGCAPVSIP